MSNEVQNQVTLTNLDVQPRQCCERCGASPTHITVVRWAIRTPSQTTRVPQQSHYFCALHRLAANEMRQLLVATAGPRSRMLGEPRLQSSAHSHGVDASDGNLAGVGH